MYADDPAMTITIKIIKSKVSEVAMDKHDSCCTVHGITPQELEVAVAKVSEGATPNHAIQNSN